MQIDFFEEFPNEENLQKGALLKGGSLVYLAAHSLAEFDEAAERLRACNPNLKAGYWPVLKKSYWISPFSYTQELLELKETLSKRETPLNVLLDLELPILSPKLFFLNSFSFFRNRAIIQEIFSLAKHTDLHFSTAEYPFAIGMTRFFLSLLGVSYSAKRYGHRRIIMYYSSMMRNPLPFNQDSRVIFKKQFAKEFKEDPSMTLGLGTISVGILGNEPILSPAELEKDLVFCSEIGLERVTIFRLGGWNDEYAAVTRSRT